MSGSTRTPFTRSSQREMTRVSRTNSPSGQSANIRLYIRRIIGRISDSWTGPGSGWVDERSIIPPST